MNALTFALLAPLTCLGARADAPEQILRNLKDPSPRVRQLAAEAAGKQKIEAAAAPLGELLKDENPGVPLTAAAALKRLGSAAVPALVAAAGDKTVSTKLLAFRVLAEIGPDAKDAAEVLAGALAHKDPSVRIKAADTLKRIGPGAKAALPALFVAAKDTGNLGAPPLDPFYGEVMGAATGVAEAAVGAALTIDPACGAKLAEAVIPDLTAALEDKDPGRAQSALAALARLGEHARPAVPALEGAQKTATEYTVMLIPGTIGTITGDSTKPYLDPTFRTTRLAYRLNYLLGVKLCA